MHLLECAQNVYRIRVAQASPHLYTRILYRDSTNFLLGENEEDEESNIFGEGEVEAGEGMQVDGDSDDDSEDESEIAEEFDGFSDDDEDEVSDAEKERIQHQREIEAEAAGLPFSTIEAGRTPGKSLARKKADKTRKDAQEELDRQRMMLPNKKRKLFDKMQYGNKQREAEAEKLRKKKRKLEKKAAV